MQVLQHRNMLHGAITFCVLTLLLYYLPVKGLLAAGPTCSASVSPHSTTPGNVESYDFNIDNSGTDSIAWIKVTRPSTHFTIVGISQSGWSDSTDSGSSTLTGGSIEPSQAFNFQMAAQASLAITSGANWVVQVSGNSDGSAAVNCSGNLSSQISGHFPNETNNGVVNIQVSNITSSSATITWSTGVPASTIVYYGTSADYGASSSLDNAKVLNHTVVLTGLANGTAYHFQVAGQDEADNIYFSADNTFLTSEGVEGSKNDTNTPTKAGLSVAIKAVPTEKTPPSVRVKTLLNKPFLKAPLVQGESADNEAVAKIEYSIDNGLNWQLVDKVSGIGGKKVIFEFMPVISEDGNYPLLVRAIDTSNNKATTSPQVLVIDRLPPQVGGVVNSVGAQIISPAKDGSVYGLAGVDQKITLSAVGGATSIQIRTKLGEKSGRSFHLTRSSDTGLWAGFVSLAQPGNYTLVAESLDGAGNHTQRELQTFRVLPATKLIERGSRKAVPNSKLTVYFLEPESKKWVLWDGLSYGQKNPQGSNNKGEAGFLLPAGKFYLKAEAPHYRTFMTTIFSIEEPTPLTADIEFTQSPGIQLGDIRLGIPWLPVVQKLDVSAQRGMKNQVHGIIGAMAPDFKLQSIDDVAVRLLTYSGRPTVLSFITTWSPQSKEQLGILSKAQSNPDINLVAVSTQESSQKVKAYLKIAGYSLPMIVDPDGTLITPYKVESLPTHYFLDRRGTVKKVMVGVLSKEEISDNLGGL